MPKLLKIGWRYFSVARWNVEFGNHLMTKVRAAWRRFVEMKMFKARF